MNFELLLGFISASFLLALMPGPDNIYVLTESLSKGWKQGSAISVGLMCGVVIHTTIVATGLSVLVFSYPMVFNTVRFAGVAYLLYLCYGAWRERPKQLDQKHIGSHDPLWSLIKTGFLMNVLNPKVTLFFMVLLPQFVSHDTDDYNVMTQMLILGLLFIASSFPVFFTISILAGKISSAAKATWFWKAAKWIKLIVLLSLALLLAFSKA